MHWWGRGDDDDPAREDHDRDHGGRGHGRGHGGRHGRHDCGDRGSSERNACSVVSKTRWSGHEQRSTKGYYSLPRRTRESVVAEADVQGAMCCLRVEWWRFLKCRADEAKYGREL